MYFSLSKREVYSMIASRELPAVTHGRRKRPGAVALRCTRWQGGILDPREHHRVLFHLFQWRLRSCRNSARVLSWGAPVDVVHRNKGLPLFPTFLADGRHFLYVAVESDEQNGAYVGSLDGKENRRVLPDVSNAVFADGRLLFIRENTYGPVF